MHDKYRGGYSQLAIELSIDSPMGKLEKGPKELKGFTVPQECNNVKQPVPPELPGTKLPTKEYIWRDPWLQLYI